MLNLIFVEYEYNYENELNSYSKSCSVPVVKLSIE